MTKRSVHVPPRRNGRFPHNVISAALATVESRDDHHPRANARARGGNEGHQWICWLFGAVTKAPQVNFGFELPSIGRKPTKAEFALLLIQAAGSFERHYGFDPRNGYAQVVGKDIPTNVAYGFYDAITTLAERFNLWEGRRFGLAVEAPSELQVYKADARTAGGCNFCPWAKGEVYKITSSQSCVEVRMCPSCVKSFRAQTVRA